MLISLLNNEIDQEEYIIMKDIQLLYTNLPKKIYGLIFRYKSRNIILINKNTSIEKQKQTIIHELAHLELNHLDKKNKLLEFKIQNIEDEADRYIKYILEGL